jgi:hypothetical protein
METATIAGRPGNRFMSKVSDFVTRIFARNRPAGKRVPPELTAPCRLPHGAFEFQIQATKGAQYEIQVSTNLRQWLSWTQDQAPADSFKIHDSEAGRLHARFYRARVGDLCSKQVIGFAGLTLSPGYSMIANPFVGNANTVSALLPVMPEQATFSKFDLLMFRLTNNLFENGRWSNPNETLLPGEGALVGNTGSKPRTLFLAGRIMHGHLSNSLPGGFSIRSSLIPVAGQLDTDLRFPIGEGDAIHIFDRDKQDYVVHTFASGKWSPAPPIIGIGESFWVAKSQAENWVQEFFPETPGETI